MKYELLELKKVFEIAPFTYSTIAQIMAEVKSEHMMRISAPIFLFHGYRGNGKTSVVKAGLENMDNIFKFADDYKDVKKQIRSISCNEVVLLDNYPQHITNAGKQEGKRKLEKFTDLASERQDYPMLIMTAENYIFDDLVDFIRTRLLEVEVPKVEENTELMLLRDFLIDNRETYVAVLKEFRGWNQTREKNSKKEFENFCKKQRCEYPEAEQRTHGMIFLYSYAFDILNDFLKERYDIQLDEKKKHENIAYLYKRKQINCGNENSLITELLNRLMDKPAFSIKTPVLTTKCARYFAGNEGCSDCDYRVFEDCEDSCGRNEYYEPMSLLLEEDYNSAVLLDSPRKIYQYPIYLMDEGPVLIVRGCTLLNLINIELQVYCEENGVMHQYYGVKQINKELFSKNHIYYNYHGGEHKTYLFNYKSCIRTVYGDIEKLHNESVLFIKLSSEQYLKLLKRREEVNYYETHKEYRHSFIKDLIKFGDHVYSFVGKKK